MDIVSKLNMYRIRAGLTIDALSERSGVPKGTLNKILGGQTKNPSITVMSALARALGRSLNDFDEAARLPSELSEEAMTLARDYDTLDGHGRHIVRSVAAEELARMEAARAESAGAVKVIPLFGASFAAGRGDPDFGNLWEDYTVPADSPADFAIRINGNSMEPYLPDGSIALARKRAPADGEVAALLLDGDFLCKQVCQDFLGNLYLFSLNRARADADQTIPHDAERSLTCFGTIIMEKVPLPADI